MENPFVPLLLQSLTSTTCSAELTGRWPKTLSANLTEFSLRVDASEHLTTMLSTKYRPEIRVMVEATRQDHGERDCSSTIVGCYGVAGKADTNRSVLRISPASRCSIKAGHTQIVLVI